MSVSELESKLNIKFIQIAMKKAVSRFLGTLVLISLIGFEKSAIAVNCQKARCGADFQMMDGSF